MKLKLTRCTEYSPESEVYELHSFSYAICSKMNESGELVSAPGAGVVKAAINGFPTMQLIRWAWGYKYLFDGILHFTGEKQEKGNVQFKKASCVALRLSYKADVPDSVRVTIEISAQTLSVGGTNINTNQS